MRRFWFLVLIVLLVGMGCAQANNGAPSSFSLTLNEDAAPNRIVISPGGSYIALGNKEGLYLYDREAASLLWTVEGDVTAMGFSPDEGLLAANMLPGDTWVGNAKIWDVKPGDLLYEVPDCSHGTVDNIVLASSGKVICGSGTGMGSGTLDFWDYTTAEHVLDTYTRVENGMLAGIIWSPDETTIAINHYYHIITILDARSGMISSEWDIYDEVLPADVLAVSGIAFNSSGDLLAASYRSRYMPGGLMGIWNIETGELDSYLESQTDAFCGIAWSHDGSTIAAGTEEGKVLIRDSSTLEVLTTFDDHQGQVSHLAFTFDDQWLVTVSKEGQVITYNVEDYLP